jgi:hypothetical protein
VLPALTNQPDSPETWQRWSYDNRTSHDAIRAGILAAGGPNLADLVLDPIDFNDFSGWLLRHALTHEQMDAALGVQSSDLSVLDPNDAQAVAAWMALHALEHYDAEQLSRAVD